MEYVYFFFSEYIELRELNFWFLSYEKEYDSCDSFPFDYDPIGIPIGS